MREQRDEQEPRELFNAEVSIYTDDCGEGFKDFRAIRRRI